MSSELTDKEKALAGQVAALQDAPARPRIQGGGLVGETLNFISAHVPPVLIKIALVVFLGYHAWDYYNRAQQMVAEVESKQGEAAKFKADADAIYNRIGADSAELAKLKAELTRLRAEGDTAKADYEAQATIIDGVPLRLATVKAEIENTSSEASKAQYELDASKQTIDGMPFTVAQKKAEVEALEAKARAAIENMKLNVMVGTEGYGGLATRARQQSGWGR
ncbi:hypothetical protein [Bradyrhizobium sp.]